MTVFYLPRGIRNNNPGNIRLSKIKWQGQRMTKLSDLSFVEFISPTYGVRALMKILLTYYFKYGLNTVESILNRYAPPCENATDSYAYHVSQLLGVRRRQQIDVPSNEDLVMLAKAITVHENGKPPKDYPKYWYEDNVYNKAFEMAKK